LGDSLAHVRDVKSSRAHGAPTARFFTQADDDIHPAVPQIQRVRMPLAAIPDDRDSSPPEPTNVCVIVVKKSCHQEIPSACDHHAGLISSGVEAAARRVGVSSAIARLPDRIVSQGPNPFARSINSPSRSGVSVISTTIV
jgi:hypothetical protein